MGSKGVSPVVATVLLMGIAFAAVSSAAIFLQGTMGDLQENVEGWLNQEDREQSSSISIDYGYNGTNGSLIVDVRNTGSRTLSVEEGDMKKWNMYIDGLPKDWKYLDQAGYGKSKNVILQPTAVVSINTTVPFPPEGNTTEVRFTGPYGIRASFVCFNENGSCET